MNGARCEGGRSNPRRDAQKTHRFCVEAVCWTYSLVLRMNVGIDHGLVAETDPRHALSSHNNTHELPPSGAMQQKKCRFFGLCRFESRSGKSTRMRLAAEVRPQAPTKFPSMMLATWTSSNTLINRFSLTFVTSSSITILQNVPPGNRASKIRGEFNTDQTTARRRTLRPSPRTLPARYTASGKAVLFNPETTHREAPSTVSRRREGGECGLLVARQRHHPAVPFATEAAQAGQQPGAL